MNSDYKTCLTNPTDGVNPPSLKAEQSSNRLAPPSMALMTDSTLSTQTSISLLTGFYFLYKNKRKKTYVIVARLGRARNPQKNLEKMFQPSHWKTDIRQSSDFWLYLLVGDPLFSQIFLQICFFIEKKLFLNCRNFKFQKSITHEFWENVKHWSLY